jgi:hypothetical protein
MENKSCKNCRYQTDNPPCLKWDCHPWENAKHWKPDYKTLQSQLSTANLLITEQIEEICGLRETLGSVKTKIEMAECCDMAWLDLAKE